MTSNVDRYCPDTLRANEMYGDGQTSDQQAYNLSQPLSRHYSSDGSTQASSPPTSPLSTSSHYTSTPRSNSYPELASSSSFHSSPRYSPPREGTALRRASNETPTGSSQATRDYPVCCLYAGCNVKPFKRRADLDRHYKHCHAPESQKESYKCDYPRCVRRREPFHRRDHFRDHLREFHKEDIEKRGGVVTEEWFDNRYLPSSWWRCPKCLSRVRIEKNGYACPGCKTPCQVKRKEARKRE